MMKQLFLSYVDAIRKGTEYRLAKYGSTETIAQSYEKAKQYNQRPKQKTLPFFASAEELKQIDIFKAKYHYWDEWTGSRYARRENPDFYKLRGKAIPLNSVCRMNAATGYYEPL